MAEGQLILRAGIDDKASPGLERIKKSLETFKPTQGMRDTHEKLGQISERLEKMKAGGEAVTGVFEKVGLGALGAIATVAGIAERMKEIAKNAAAISHISRETGFKPDELKGLQDLGKQYDIAPEKMTAWAQKFASVMDDIHHRRGEVWGELAQKAPDVANQLFNEKNMKNAFGAVLGLLQKYQKDPQQQRAWAELFGGADLSQLFDKGPEELRKRAREAFEEAAKDWPTIQKQAEALDEAWKKFDKTIDRLEEKVAPGVLAVMTDFAERMSKSFEQDVKDVEKIVELFKAAEEWADHLFDRKPVELPPAAKDQMADEIARLKAMQAPIDERIAKERAGANNPELLRRLQENRDALQLRIDKIEEAVKKGVIGGMKEHDQQSGVQRSAFDGADGAARLILASYYGGGTGFGGGVVGGRAGLPAPRALPRIAGGGAGALPRPRGAGSGELPGGTGGPILDMISNAEGTKRGYNDSFAHQVPGDLTDKTLNEIRAIQRRMRGSSAIGRYQFMAKTLQEEMGKLGLTGDEKFSPEMQDRLARSRLKFRGYDRWKAGRLTDDQFLDNLAHEWAGMTSPRTGRGIYRGQNTSFPIDRERRALEQERRSKSFRDSDANRGAPLEVNHSGGATVTLRLPRELRHATAMAEVRGMISHVKVDRGSRMTMAGAGADVG